MSVKVVDKSAEFEQKTIRSANIFLRFFAEDVVKEAKPNTPKDTGRLRADVLKQVLGLKGKIKWSKNYAIYQETIQYQNYTSGGGPHFAENAVKAMVGKTGSIAKRANLVL